MLLHDYRQDEDDQNIPEDNEIETVYLYVYKDDPEKKPWSNWKFPHFNAAKIVNRFMQVVAIALLSGFVLVPDMPHYQVYSVTLKAIFLPLQHLQATTAIIPTGHKTIPATKAHGYLTFYNGSAFTQSLQAGFILTTQDGTEVSTDYAVTIPALNSSTNPPSLGVVSVSSHAVIAGSNGNIQAYAINQTYAGTIFAKNLAPFTGGRDSYTETYATNNDKAKALDSARQQVQNIQATQNHTGLFAGCKEIDQQSSANVTVSLTCQYLTFKAPKNAQVLYARIVGRSIVVTVEIVELPR